MHVVRADQNGQLNDLPFRKMFGEWDKYRVRRLKILSNSIDVS